MWAKQQQKIVIFSSSSYSSPSYWCENASEEEKNERAKGWVSVRVRSILFSCWVCVLFSRLFIAHTCFASNLWRMSFARECMHECVCVCVCIFRWPPAIHKYFILVFFFSYSRAFSSLFIKLLDWFSVSVKLWNCFTTSAFMCFLSVYILLLLLLLIFSTEFTVKIVCALQFTQIGCCTYTYIKDTWKISPHVQTVKFTRDKKTADTLEHKNA